WGAGVVRALGERWGDISEAAGRTGPALHSADGDPPQSAAFGDIDGDGDTDVVLRMATGALRVWRNDGGNRLHSLRVRLEAQQSNRTAAGTKVDLRAGSLRQHFETSAAVPSAAPPEILFGL